MKATIQRTSKPAKFFTALGILVGLSAVPIAQSGNESWPLFAIIGAGLFALGRVLKWWLND